MFQKQAALQKERTPYFLDWMGEEGGGGHCYRTAIPVEHGNHVNKGHLGCQEDTPVTDTSSVQEQMPSGSEHTGCVEMFDDTQRISFHQHSCLRQ